MSFLCAPNLLFLKNGFYKLSVILEFVLFAFVVKVMIRPTIMIMISTFIKLLPSLLNTVSRI